MGDLTKDRFSSKLTDWETPQEFFDRLNEEFRFTLDACANDKNAKCAKYYTEKEDGLKQDWANERVFVNPPYGRQMIEWLIKAARESENGAIVVLLIPARTNTRWWDELVMRSQQIRFVTGRLKFGNAKHGLPFPLAIVVYGGGTHIRPIVSTFKAYAVKSN